MTFDQYLTQKDPKKLSVFSVKVPHDHEAVTLGQWSGSFYFMTRPVDIKINDQSFSYVQRRGHGGLWTSDDDGNKKSRSVFKIMEP